MTYFSQVFGTADNNRRLIQEFDRGANKQLRCGAVLRIEFERDTKALARLRHAENQLRDYFAANYNAGRRNGF